MFPKPEAMIFDMDGTLFQTESLLIPAYHATFDEMRREGSYTESTPDEGIIIGCLGMVLEEIWRRVLPDAEERVRQRADELFVRYELEYLENGYGELYPGVEDTLSKLKDAGIRLFVASNGLEDYVRGVARLKGIAPLFEELYSAGEHQTSSKVDLVRLLLERHKVRSAWMVGDRSSDVEAGLKNGLTVIGCDYAGFGDGSELNGSHVRLRSFAELPGLYA
ncbi:HAD family hydrolase [Paenibacillus sp. YN15]|uniref:HAD family hydrolase n=1 Tax=Paenibacillus sp. YN15 TaxID=1742774 RepID=UPI00215D024D|nr:HAD family hydrolase [Paenibacillus sp. YN15]